MNLIETIFGEAEATLSHTMTHESEQSDEPPAKSLRPRFPGSTRLCMILLRRLRRPVEAGRL